MSAAHFSFSQWQLFEAHYKNLARNPWNGNKRYTMYEVNVFWFPYYAMHFNETSLHIVTIFVFFRSDLCVCLGDFPLFWFPPTTEKNMSIFSFDSFFYLTGLCWEHNSWVFVHLLWIIIVPNKRAVYAIARSNKIRFVWFITVICIDANIYWR